MMYDQKIIDKIRKMTPQQIAQDICSVQPMQSPFNIDYYKYRNNYNLMSKREDNVFIFGYKHLNGKDDQP